MPHRSPPSSEQLATRLAMLQSPRAVRVRFGLMGTVGVVRVLVGAGPEAGALPESVLGAISLSVDETGASVAYVLVVPALGAGA